MIRYLAFIHVLLAGVVGLAQNYNPGIQQKLDEVNRSIQLVRQFQNLGVKTANSQASRNTVNWLVDEYKSYGYDSIRVDSFEKNGRWYRNVVTTKIGSTKEVLLVCGHFDTRNGPGANDNGSGVAAILETARLLKDLNTTRTVLFVHFDGEEEGYIGSQHYVDYQMLAIRDHLYLVFNVDQIGGTFGVTGNDKIVCERDEMINPSKNNAPSALVTDTLAQLCRLYTNLTPVISNAFLSDYIPFEEKGMVITGLFQNATDKFTHRPTDTLGNMDTVSFKQAVRLTCATTIHFAQADKYLTAQREELAQINIYPNPAFDNVNVEAEDFKSLKIRAYNHMGEVVLSDIGQPKISVSDWTNGLYLIEVDYGDGRIRRQKILVQH